MLTEKDLARCNKELLELHKKVITDYLVKRSMKLPKRKKFFFIYDHFISEENIKEFFFRPITLFIKALILGKLDSIRDYIPIDIKPKRKRKSKK